MFNYNPNNFGSNYIDVRNNLIIDTQFGDVNGDKFPDIVYLMVTKPKSIL